jgi:GUN4-like/Caspase domain
LIAYATEPDDVAEDGGNGNRHSPYTQSLLTHLRTPGIDILVMLRQVARDVLEATDGRQYPYFEGNPIDVFSFNPTIAVPLEPIAPSPSPSEPSQPNLYLALLRSSLGRGNFRQADEQTGGWLLAIADTDNSGWIDHQEVENLYQPEKRNETYAAIRAIDDEWLRASNGRFGFSVQARIWREVGSPDNFNGTDEAVMRKWEEWGDRVGWRRNGTWSSWNYLSASFNSSDPSLYPAGMLPGPLRVDSRGMRLGFEQVGIFATVCEL